MSRKGSVLLFSCTATSLLIHYFLIYGFPIHPKTTSKKGMEIFLRNDFQEFSKDSYEMSVSQNIRGSFVNSKKEERSSQCKKKYVGVGLATYSKKTDGPQNSFMNIDGKIFIKIMKVDEGSPAQQAGIVSGNFIESSIYSIANKPPGTTILATVYDKKTNKIRKTDLISKEICYK